jgi:hypothetical protein
VTTTDPSGAGPAAVLHSAAQQSCPDPDFADAHLFTLPAGSSGDPAKWARRIFDLPRSLWWVKGLMVVRTALVPLIGVRPPTDLAAFDVDEVHGCEALIVKRDRHLDWWAAVAVDTERNLLQVTTFVKLHGWRGRLYFAPVRVLHRPVLRSMIAAATRRAPAGMASTTTPARERTEA